MKDRLRFHDLFRPKHLIEGGAPSVNPTTDSTRAASFSFRLCVLLGAMTKKSKAKMRRAYPDVGYATASVLKPSTVSPRHRER